MLHPDCIKTVESGTRQLKTVGFGFLLLLFILEVDMYYPDVDPGSTNFLLAHDSRLTIKKQDVQTLEGNQMTPEDTGVPTTFPVSCF